MAGAAQHISVSTSRFDRLWWLPADGRGNGLDDIGWAPLVDAADDTCAQLIMDDFARHGMPGYAARVRRRDRGVIRIWVGTSRWGSAVSRLMAILPALDQQHDGPVAV